jgi:hypothetical protein
MERKIGFDKSREGAMSPKTSMASMAAVALATIFSWGAHGPAMGQTKMQPPGFHHIHLNSVDPEAARAFYM